MSKEYSWSAIDTSENLLKNKTLLSTLLEDHTLKHNISWMTDQYEFLGEGYQSTDTIKVRFIAGLNDGILKPRINKPIAEQEKRSREKGEVFTPAWVCNKQNNLIDSAWFGVRDSFNHETENGWSSTQTAIVFPPSKNWRDYVCCNRLEVSCGEAPYLTSRYDTVTGEFIPVSSRIGLLDRKLRVVTENCGTPKEWTEWASKALKSIYGYDWQGDNVILARENLLCATIEAYQTAFYLIPSDVVLLHWAHIISWNIWQMDGLKYVVPNSCTNHKTIFTLMGEETVYQPCPGCKNGDNTKHTGRYCMVMDWRKHKALRFVDLAKEAKK